MQYPNRHAVPQWVRVYCMITMVQTYCFLNGCIHASADLHSRMHPLRVQSCIESRTGMKNPDVQKEKISSGA